MLEEQLNQLYEGYGYRKFRMSKFEDYDLYAQNKDFLKKGHIITFTDVDGSLKALKPDITQQRGQREGLLQRERLPGDGRRL